MAESYRESVLSCPACRSPLEATLVRDATIDVCALCGGIWVDWFDGDLVQLVRASPVVAGAQIPQQRSSDAKPECPRCHQELKDERYQESHGDVLRCPDCAGVFVPRSSVGAVAGLAVVTNEKPPLDALGKLSHTLQRWLGWQES